MYYTYSQSQHKYISMSEKQLHWVQLRASALGDEISFPHHPHSPQHTLLIVWLLNKSKDKLMMAYTQGQNT